MSEPVTYCDETVAEVHGLATAKIFLGCQFLNFRNELATWPDFTSSFRNELLTLQNPISIARICTVVKEKSSQGAVRTLIPMAA